MNEEEFMQKLLKVSLMHIKVLFYFQRNDKVSIVELSKHFNKHRTTIQKIVSRLKSMNLLLYRQFNLPRGYMLIYSINTSELINKLNKHKHETIKYHENIIDKYINAKQY